MALRKSKLFLYTAGLLLVLASCRKGNESTPLPIVDIDYIELNDKEVKYNSASAIIDLNADNEPDLVFGVLLVGDPLNNVDKRQYRVSSGIFTKLPVNHVEQVPMLSKGDTVFLNNFDGYSWNEISSIILVERVQNLAGTIEWRGNWQTASKNYLPIQVVKNEKRYTGWVELTVDISNEKIILHRTAISRHPEKNIRA